MNPADLERLIDGELKRLPAPRAPRTLLPRVMAAITHRRPAPWYARPWLAWPRAWQVASVAALAAGVSMLAWPALAWSPFDGGVAGRISDLAESLHRVSVLARVSWNLVLEPVAFYLMVLAVTLSLGCAALWAVLERVALGGASES